MKAQLLSSISPIETRPLQLVDRPVPQPKAKEILVKIAACGVDVISIGELTHSVKAIDISLEVE